jgi:hypothetical protein
LLKCIFHTTREFLRCSYPVTRFVIINDRSIITMCDNHYRTGGWLGAVKNGRMGNGESVRELTSNECLTYEIMNS